jgi:mannan endo-1,4-beta-mannosidase
MTYAADPGLRAYVDEVLQESAEMGLGVVRTWAFNDGGGWNALQTSPGTYDETVFQGLDYVLHKASALGLRVILPLVNNWDDYGGMNQYVSWDATYGEAPIASGHDDFYTDADTKQWYKNHAAALISRVNTYNGRTYGEDPTIFAWELGNEPRCPSDKTGNTLVAWIAEMSAYIKSLDSNHMVTTGIEGFYDDNSGPWYLSGWEGVDFIRDHQISTVDFATAHSWPHNWGLGFSAIMSLLSRQIADAAGVIGKPFILEEFGVQRGGDLATRNMFYQAYYDSIHTNQAGGSNFWILYHDDYPDYDGNGVYYPADASTIALIEENASKMENLTLSNYADFRYKDIAQTTYAESYARTYLYRDAGVSVTFDNSCYGNLTGHLSATGLKPNFAYQVKLTGKPEALWGAGGDDPSNERIGYAGRWWEVSPNPGNRDDAYYEAHQNDPGYVFQGYLVFDFFLTDGSGAAELDFTTDGSYHVLWWVGQRAAGSCDSPPKWATVGADPASPAYDVSAGPTDVGVYAEIERLCAGETQLAPGFYRCGLGLAEESFHQSGPNEGTWAAAMTSNDMEFEVLPPPGCARVDEVDIGDPESEFEHNMIGWGPVEPAASGGSYGGVDDCRVVYAPESDGDGEAWASIDLDLGPGELTPKYITLRHLEGIAQDAFDVWFYPVGRPDYAVKVYAYPGDGRTVELWYRHTITVAGAGPHTLWIESKGPLWSGFPTFGQMAFDSVYVESCENSLFTDAVDIGADDASESDHGVTVGGWGPPEPQTHGGSWGGIAYNPEDRTCRVVWEAGSSDAERNASIYLNHGTSTSRKDVLVNVLEGLAQDAFEVYIDEVDDRNLLYKYGGLHFAFETWVAHTLNYHATGVHTLILRANPTDDDPWNGFNSFGKIAVRNMVLGVDRHPEESPLFALDENPGWSEAGGTFRQDTQTAGESKILSYNQGKNNWSFWVHMDPLGPTGEMGVVFDYIDEDNYATAMLCATGGDRLEIKRCTGGAWSLVEDIPVTAPSYPVRMGLFKRDGTVSVELGGSTHNVPSSTDGLVGLVTGDMTAEFSDLFFLPTVGDFETPLTIEGTAGVPPRGHGGMILLGNYPNPFGPATAVLFELAERSPVELSIYDASGRLVRRIGEQIYPAGRGSIVWDGVNVAGRRAASGVYFYKLEVSGVDGGVGKMTIAR